MFSQNIHILEVGKLEEVLRNNGIHTRHDQNRAKELLNILGVALSYSFMDSSVINPYWISHGVYKVIDYLQRNKSKFINYNELDIVFADERGTYPEGKNKYILELMEHHKIGFRNKEGVRGLIVPCVASQFKPKDIVINLEPESLVTQVERDDLQEFPADFFYRYICANENDIKKSGEMWVMWQTGVVLAGESASALVELIQNRRIEITVWGLMKEEYSKKLESLIDDLLKEYHFTPHRESRKRGEKLIKIITLVFEAISKGVAKAWIETTSGSIVK